MSTRKLMVGLSLLSLAVASPLYAQSNETQKSAPAFNIPVIDAQNNNEDPNMPMVSIPVVDARSGRLSQEEIDKNQPIESMAPQNSTSAMDIIEQARTQVPQIASQRTASAMMPKANDLYQKAISMYEPSQSHKMKPMESKIIPVGQGVMNSIVTNFNMVAVKTSDKKSLFEMDGGYLYATIKTNQPVGLILFEEGVPESQIAVTLVPIAAPPAVVKLDVDISSEMRMKSAAFQKKIREEMAMENAMNEQVFYSDERTQRMVDLLTPVAQGDLPRGFSLSSDIPAHYKKPCAIPIYQNTGQRLMGGNEVIDVVHVKNTSNKTFQMTEEKCLTDDVIAVGLYMKSYLQPGEDMEVYIVRDKFYQREMQRTQRRPRLTGE